MDRGRRARVEGWLSWASYGEQSRILDALNAGALRYLLRHTDPDDLIDAVRAAARAVMHPLTPAPHAS